MSAGYIMIMGMSVATFTLVHVIISLIAIATGIVVMIGMWSSNRMPAMTAVFLITTILTSVTGFFFPLKAIGPPHIFGVVSLLLLVFTLLGLYAYHLVGRWRWIYVTTAVIALYLNVVVLVVQSFQKIPALNQLSPVGNEPAVAVTQGIVLILFIASGWKAVKRFRPVAGVTLAGSRPTPAAG
jgi:hypothetical protein